MRALLLGYIQVTDEHQPAVAICGTCAVLMILAIAHSWGLL